MGFPRAENPDQTHILSIPPCPPPRTMFPKCRVAAWERLSGECAVLVRILNVPGKQLSARSESVPPIGYRGLDVGAATEKGSSPDPCRS